MTDEELKIEFHIKVKYNSKEYKELVSIFDKWYKEDLEEKTDKGDKK